jgi:predicted lysophospholipase L1 biosynthesis ABC-type transport system permease subunit
VDVSGLLFAVLVALAIGYLLRNRKAIPGSVVAWGLVLALVCFVLPLVLNHVLDSDFLHRFHKFLAFTAPVVFVAWIAWMKHRTHLRSSRR